MSSLVCPTPAPRHKKFSNAVISFCLASMLLVSLAAPAWTQDDDSDPAKEALVLLSENQSSILWLIDRFRSISQSKNRSIPSDVSKRIDRARATILTTDRLIAEAPGVPVTEVLRDMQRIQEDLFEYVLGSGSEDVRIDDDATRDLVLRFGVAKAEAESLLSISYSERSQILRKYSYLHSVAASSLGGGPADGTLSIGADLQEDPDLTPEQLAKKKERYADWKAEQQRREQAHRRSEAARRAEEQRQEAERKKNEANRDTSRPKVGTTIRKEDLPPPIDPAVKAQMTQWHPGYLRAIRPLKGALQQFMPLRLAKHRNQRLIRACQRLFEATTATAKDGRLPAPDPVVGTALTTAVGEFKNAADACLYDQMDKAREHITAGEKSLGEAAATMGRYGLGM